MSTDQAATDTNANANPATATVTGLDDRVASVLAEMNATPDQAGEAEATTPSAAESTPAAEPATEPAAETKTPDQRAKERQDRLNALREKNAEQLRAKQAREQSEGATAKVRELEDQLRMKNAEFEALRDPSKFFEIAQKNGVDADSLAEFLRTGKTQAKPAAQDETIVALQRRIDEQQARIDAMAQEGESRKQAAQRQQVERQFFEAATAGADEFPLVAAMRANPKFGDEAVLEMAYAVVQTLPPQATYDDVVAEIETQLESFASLRSASPSQTKPTPKAAAKAPALTNRHAAASTSMDDEDSPRSLEERVALTNEWLRSKSA